MQRELTTRRWNAASNKALQLNENKLMAFC